ncbi:MAG: EAL domain-containing protein [Pseudomonadota bacterium]
MSLSRALVAFLSLLLLLILAGIFMVSIGNSRTFLEAQMASHAQDTATSLGVTLTSAIAQGDAAAAMNMVDAIFDRGYYEYIKVTAADAQIDFERRNPMAVARVPAWMIRLVPLACPDETADIMNGWQPGGTVAVRSHPGYAYAELWSNVKGFLYWFLGAWAAGTALMIAGLHFLLSPLRELEAQAAAISNREFPVIEKQPWSREMRRVVAAMNRMSEKLKSMFHDQAQFIEILRKDAYTDSVTGLSNRRHFEARLRDVLEAADPALPGTLLLLCIEDFKRFNQQQGRMAGDAMLRAVAGIISRACDGQSGEVMVARLNGAEFAVLVHGIDGPAADELAGRVLSALGALDRQAGYDKALVFSCGMADTAGCETTGQVLAEADLALRAAQTSGKTGWQRAESRVCQPQDILTAGRLRQILQEHMDREAVVLAYAPVIRLVDGSVHHHEILARLQTDTGERLAAGLFVHMAEQMGCIARLDQLVIEALERQMASGAAPAGDLAVNISATSLQDDGFVDWLCGFLEKRPDVANRLCIEATEQGVVSHLDALQRHVSRIIGVCAGFGLDRFGMGGGPFGYLIRLKLAYIKIDGSFIRGIAGSREGQFFVNAIANIARGLDIQVAASHVENQEDRDTLVSLGVDAAFGRWLNGK